jgi:hypothetical protein
MDKLMQRIEEVEPSSLLAWRQEVMDTYKGMYTYMFIYIT